MTKKPVLKKPSLKSKIENIVSNEELVINFLKSKGLDLQILTYAENPTSLKSRFIAYLVKLLKVNIKSNLRVIEIKAIDNIK
jgi:hypothetical protein